MNLDETVTIWLKRLKTGDPTAAEQLWHRYFGQVVALAKSRFSSAYRKAADEEDVALSVFDTLCRGVQAGKFPQLTDRDGLWALLVALTVRRVCDKANYERRQKRGGGKVLAETEIDGKGDLAFRLDTLLDQVPTPETAAIMEEECTRLFSQLDEELRPIALGKLEGRTNQELAEQLQCGQRTIERRLELIRKIWQQP